MRQTISQTVSQCERAGHADGLAAGLALALSGLGADAAVGEVAAIPTAAVPAGTPMLEHELAAREGISFVRPRSHVALPPAELTALAARLAAARLGVTRRLAERVVEHLAGRVAGGEPTLRKQLVQGTLADAQVTTETALRCLLVAGDSVAAVTDVHDRLTALDWELTKLLGAGGYLRGGPARGAYISRLAANCWVPRAGAA